MSTSRALKCICSPQKVAHTLLLLLLLHTPLCFPVYRSHTSQIIDKKKNNKLKLVVSQIPVHTHTLPVKKSNQPVVIFFRQTDTEDIKYLSNVSFHYAAKIKRKHKTLSTDPNMRFMKGGYFKVFNIKCIWDILTFICFFHKSIHEDERKDTEVSVSPNCWLLLYNVLVSCLKSHRLVITLLTFQYAANIVNNCYYTDSCLLACHLFPIQPVSNPVKLGQHCRMVVIWSTTPSNGSMFDVTSSTIKHGFDWSEAQLCLVWKIQHNSEEISVALSLRKCWLPVWMAPLNLIRFKIR